MGACDFECYGYGKTLSDAYKQAVEHALYEHGHDPYNGTVSTTSRVTEVTKEYPRYGTKACTAKINKTFSGEIHKWECYAIEVTGKALKEYRARHGLQRKRIRVWYLFGLAGC